MVTGDDYLRINLLCQQRRFAGGKIPERRINYRHHHVRLMFRHAGGDQIVVCGIARKIDRWSPEMNAR